MIETRETIKNGYSPLKNYPLYMINTEKGTLINKTNKFLGYIPKNGSNVVIYLKKDSKSKHEPRFLNELVYNQENAIPLNRKTHWIKHKNNDHNDCSYSNLKLISKIASNSNKLNFKIKIEDLEGNTTFQSFNSLKKCRNETGVSLYYLHKVLEGEEVIIKDKRKKFRVSTI